MDLAYDETMRILVEQIKRRNALITQLCEALDKLAFYPQDDHLGHLDLYQLIERAREATR